MPEAPPASTILHLCLGSNLHVWRPLGFRAGFDLLPVLLDPFMELTYKEAKKGNCDESPGSFKVRSCPAVWAHDGRKTGSMVHSEEYTCLLQDG